VGRQLRPQHSAVPGRGGALPGFASMGDTIGPLGVSWCPPALGIECPVTAMGLNQLLEVIPPDSADEIALARAIDYSSLPRHVAVIMDGNGRWAKLRQKRRIEGHRAGTASVRENRRDRARTGVGVLTLYAFSVENWKRPPTEVSALMGLSSTTSKPSCRRSSSRTSACRSWGGSTSSRPTSRRACATPWRRPGAATACS